MNSVIWRVEHFVEIDSTNSWLAQQARAGADEGLVAYADYQSAGRGRLERAWEAPLGSALLASILLRPANRYISPQLVVAAVALSARSAIQQISGVDVGIKWPNDLLVGEKKIAGLLTELVITPASTAFIVGIGINLTAEGPDPSKGTSLRALTGDVVEAGDLLDALLRELGIRRALLDSDEGAALLQREYEGASITIGRRVRIERYDDVLVGTAIGVDPSGQLLVSADGETHLINVGDVVHLRIDESDNG